MAMLLEVENNLLHERIAALAEENATLKGKRGPEQLALEITELKEQLDAANRRMFGDSSERRKAEHDDEASEKKPQTGHGPTPQPDLPIRDVPLKCEPEELACRSCGGLMEEIPGMTEDSQSVSLVRRAFFIEKLQRQKYRCRCGGDIKVAATNHKMIEGGRYSIEVAAHIAELKYLDHMPLDRQRRSMNRQGLNVTTSALWDQINALAGVLEPSYELLRKYILGADVIGVDETRWHLFGNDKSKKTWWCWVMTCSNAAFYGIAPSRSAKTAAAFLGDFKGTAVVDGYAAYQTLAKSRSDFRLALCWSHARRKFVEAEPNYSECGQAIELIGELFRIDRDTENPALLSGDAKAEAAAERLRQRQDRAPPILSALREWALGSRGLPKSQLRKAIDYTLGHWEPLGAFLDDPFVPLDNNASERALRGVVVGRKNHYGSKSVRGTQVAAILYTLMETAKMNGLDPHQWTVDAVYRLKAGEGVIPLPLA